MKTTVLSFFIITGMLLADVSAQNTDFTDYQTLAVNGINYQILTHANGDAAMDQMIRTMKPLEEK